jgi:hypothetical protein
VNEILKRPKAIGKFLHMMFRYGWSSLPDDDVGTKKKD